MITKKLLSDESGLTVAFETILLFAISVIFLGMIFFSFQDMNQRQSKVLTEEELITIGNSIVKQMYDMTVEARASNKMGSNTSITSEFWIPYNIAYNAYKVTLMPGRIILETTSSPYISVEVPVNSDINLAENSTIYSNDGKYKLEYDSKSSAIYFMNGGVVPFDDINAPTISIDSPDDNATISLSTYINVTVWDDVGVSRVEYYVNGSYRYTAGPPYNWLWYTPEENDGNYTVTAVAYDAAGHTKSASRNFNVSNPFSYAPDINLITPVIGENTTFKKPIINAVITDDKQLNFSTIWLKIDGDFQTSNASFVNFPPRKSTFTYTPSDNMAEGAHNVQIYAEDSNSNFTLLTRVFNITPVPEDAGTPIPIIVYPTESTLLEPGSTISVSYIASDIGVSGLDNLTINVLRSDGLLYRYQRSISIYPDPVYFLDQNTWDNNSNKYMEGMSYTINITVFDRAGNKGIAELAPLAVSVPGMSSELEVNTSSVTKSNNKLQNIKLKDNVSDTVSVTITAVNISWSGGQQIEIVKFGAGTYWKYNGAGTPDGKQNSGTLLTLGNTYTAPQGTFENMEIQLSSNVLAGETFTIIFHLSDTTTKTVTFTAP